MTSSKHRGQFRVTCLTSVAVAAGVVQVSVPMDGWSRRIVGYATSRRIDVRLTLAALDAAIALRQPPPGCVRRDDRTASARRSSSVARIR